jgi:predicted AlkP superfamily phosphohydrolase/phosphomutase/tetratricopeptide (TPR) repeat protein
MTETAGSPPRIRSARHPDRVLLVGWDSADWQLIEPLIGAGLMPALGGFRDRGAWGPLATLRPMLSPMLWNTIATGTRADRHGIHGFTEPTPGGDGVRPVSSGSRRCKALWNIATQCGLRSHVVGWYASHPAEPIAGSMVSNQFEQAVGRAALPDGCVHPPQLAAELRDCLVHPAEIDAAAVLAFVPDAARVALQPVHRLDRLRGLLAQTATVHAVATTLVAREDWDFAAVYYEGLDRFGHEFMEFHPPRMEQVSAEEFSAYRHCIDAAYRFHDMLLDALLQLAGPNTAVVLVSDHGYASDHRRPDPRPGKAGPVDWHRPYGVFAAAGPGIRPGGRVFGGGLLDIAPTLLALLGLAAAADMPGRVLAEVLDAIEPPPRIPSWEAIPGDCGMRPDVSGRAAADERAAIEQLVALGYVEPPPEDGALAAREAAASNRLQLAQARADAGDYREALAELAAVEASQGEGPTLRAMRASYLLGAGDVVAARSIVDALRVEGHATPGIEMLTASVEFAEGRPAAALERLERLAAVEPARGPVHDQIGQIRLAMGAAAEAVEAFSRAIELDPQDVTAHCGLAEASLALGLPGAALDSGLEAASLVHAMPRAHHAIGRALAALGDHAGAVEALRVCIAQAPSWIPPRRELDALLGRGDSAG